MPSTTSPLSALASIISQNVQVLESIGGFPSLDSPTFTPSNLDEAAKNASQLIIAAAAQLIATVRNPEETIRELAPSVYTTAALGYVVDTDISDILAEAGPKGLNASDIAAKSGGDASHTTRILRYLATRHIFRELSPNVFTNNRISAAFIKGKSVKEMQSEPLHRFDTAGTASFIGHVADEALKSSSGIIPFLKTPASAERPAAPFNLAMNTPSSLWEWFETPNNDWRLRRFMAVMTKDGALFPDSIFVSAIDWAKLSSDDTVVDIGGNLGTVTLTLAKTFEKPKFVVQDLGKVIGGAKGFWEGMYPEAISAGRVKLQEHSFFDPQPLKSASVYFLRFILHDWPESECIKIMQHLRDASAPTSKLILFEFCVPYACEDTSGAKGDAKESGSEMKKSPFPLLANFGAGGGTYPTFVDLQMMNFFNGQERTLGEFIDLGKKTGWKLEEVKYERLATLIFVPVSRPR